MSQEESKLKGSKVMLQILWVQGALFHVGNHRPMTVSNVHSNIDTQVLALQMDTSYLITGFKYQSTQLQATGCFIVTNFQTNTHAKLNIAERFMEPKFLPQTPTT